MRHNLGPFTIDGRDAIASIALIDSAIRIQLRQTGAIAVRAAIRAGKDIARNRGYPKLSLVIAGVGSYADVMTA